MRIQLNGAPSELPGPMTILALLERLNIDPRIVAVELDTVVVKRARYAETMVSEGAEVEIVQFIGGGGGGRRSAGTIAEVLALSLKCWRYR